MPITATVTGGAVQLTGNPVIINCTGGSVPSGASEYMVTLRVISADGKLEGAPLHFAVTPYPDGTVTFDLSSVLDQPVEMIFDNSNSNKFVAYPHRAFNIQVQPGERYIDQQGLLVENWFAVSDIFQMIKGGLSPRQNAMMKAIGQTYFSKYIQGKRFLTPRPQGDFVHPKQPVKLWFMPYENGAANFVIKAYYADGTNVVSASPLTLNADNLYEFNCNPEIHSINLHTESGEELLYYDVYLSNGASAITDTRRFQVDWDDCERPYFLFFANSLGGIDDIYLSGYGIDAFSVEGTKSYRPVRETDTVYTPTIVSPNKSGYNKWTINSGWKSITTLQFYRDLLLSKQAWFLYPNISNTSRIIVPVIIEPSGDQLINRQDDQWSIDIEFTEAHTSRFSFDNRSF